MAQAGRKLPVSSRRCSLAAALTQSSPHGSLALRATGSSPSVSAAPAASTAPAMLRPVHAVSPPCAWRAESRLAAAQLFQDAPEHALHEIGGAPLVGMGQRIACRRRDPKPRDGPALAPQPVADIIETKGVRQLHKHHLRQMALHRVAAGQGIHPMLPGDGLDNPLRNIFEKLAPAHSCDGVVAGRMETKLFWLAS